MGKPSFTTLSVNIVPRASRNEVVGWSGVVLRLRGSVLPLAMRTMLLFNRHYCARERLVTRDDRRGSGKGN